MVKAVTQTAPDAEIGWSRRRHASGRRSGCVRHKYRLKISFIVNSYNIVESATIAQISRSPTTFALLRCQCDLIVFPLVSHINFIDTKFYILEQYYLLVCQYNDLSVI